MRLPSFTFTKYSVPSDRHVERNEDNSLIDKQRGLIAIFDGVGGSSAGEIASQVAAQVIRRGWKQVFQQFQQESDVPILLANCESVDLHATLVQLIEEAHEQIRTTGVKRAVVKGIERTGAEDQATTVALAVFCQRQDTNGYTMVYGHVGDSRIYLLRGTEKLIRGSEKLVRLTQDDGYLAKLLQNATISEADALRIDQAMHAEELSETELSYFNKRNGITQALGDAKPPVIHVGETTIFPGDRILLCSDGVHDNLTDGMIEDMLTWGSRTTVARLIVQSAQRGSREELSRAMRAKPDDISAIVVTCNG